MHVTGMNKAENVAVAQSEYQLGSTHRSYSPRLLELWLQWQEQMKREIPLFKGTQEVVKFANR